MPHCRQTAAILAAFVIACAPIGEGVGAAEPTTESAAAGGAAPPDFAAIVARTASAVVAVKTRQIFLPDLPSGMPDAFAERLRERGELRPRIGSATGSGFIVSRDGHIVTNDHVVGLATEIEVILDDGTAHPASVVGTDPATDLAVLRIDPAAFGDPEPVVAAWGNSDALVRGSWTIAVGSPFGLGGTVTVGVLSARQRDIDEGLHEGFLQTDAAINVGNSGGPLFNVAGEVVGVNTAIFSPTGASVGIGFAVPSNTAERVVRQLIETGEVRRGFIGLGLQDLDAVMARAFGYSEEGGALVGSVDPHGPAEAAGLRPGDVVLRLDDQAIGSAADLSRAVAEREPGARVHLAYLRAGEGEASTALALGQQPRPDVPVIDVDDSPDDARLGLTLRPLTEAYRDEFEPNAAGVIVRSVRPGGLGAESGLRRGDLILEAGQAPVADADDIVAAWHEARRAGRPLLLQILRGQVPLYVAIEG
jgi:serine protease Do